MAAKIDYQPNDICVLRISGISKRSEFAAKQSTLACKIDVGGQIIGDESGLLKLIFRPEDMRLLGVHVVGEQATELVHIGLMAMLAGVSASVFNRVCFNYPTLGELYKLATYEALLKRDGVVANDSK